jgi:glycosyltransferase involved in cell wall biosynthesis
MEELISVYALPREKLVIVPNSVDTKINRFTPEIERKSAKRDLGFLDTPTVLYMGSWHPPNLAGAKYIMDELAPRFPQCTFLILGTVCDYLWEFGSQIPKNMLLFGQMEVRERQELYAISDVAVNPVTFGSGTSTKTLIHMATGVPVITTPFGIRGLGAQDGVHALVREIPAFPNALAELLSNHELRERLRVNARRLTEERFDSGSVGAMLRNRLLEAIRQPQSLDHRSVSVLRRAD